jgi:dihydropteroate synthase
VSVPISVDTRKGPVAAAALGAGADLINDISALDDPDLAAAVAAAGCPVVLMHSRGQLRSMQRQIAFGDVAAEVTEDLERLVKRASTYGVARQQILIDPGIGFGKTALQNLELLRQLDVIQTLALPVLVGASRKSFIGEIAGAGAGERLSGSLAAVGWAAHHGAAVVRVHDVADTHQYLQVWQAIDSARGQTG